MLDNPQITFEKSVKSITILKQIYKCEHFSFYKLIF